MKSDNGPADKRKMQVLPGRFGGQFDKDPLNLDDSEHRRKQAAVEVRKQAKRHSLLLKKLYLGNIKDHEGTCQKGLIQ